MASKNFFKHKIVSFIAIILSAFTLAIIVIPPTINLNFLKPKIENIILSQTGIPAKINGDIHFSLLGTTTIIANDITVPNGTISSCIFTIPFLDIFDLKNAQVSSDISVSGASVLIERLTPFSIKNTIRVHNSNVRFLNKEYTIIDATLTNRKVNAIIRTDQHKYEIQS
ncbi:MAG: hypothetical protein ACLRFP_04550, partial [Alphaproteobacteria bacterium]